MIALTDRYKFPIYADRAAFKAATGMEAPVFNPAYPIKRWFDPSAGSSPQTYLVFNGNPNNPALSAMTIPGAEAGLVNLTGTPVFPKYVIDPTKATSQLSFSGLIFPPQPIDPSTLSTKSQADSLAAICGGIVVDQDATPNQFFNITWNGETRRRYRIQFNTGPGTPTTDPNRASYVGQILQTLYAKGVGAPFHWSASQLAVGLLEPVFEVVPDGAGVTAVVPDPVQLNPGEQLASYSVGPGVTTVIVTQVGAPVPTTGSAGGFTEIDRAMLVSIYKATGGA